MGALLALAPMATWGLEGWAVAIVVVVAIFALVWIFVTQVAKVPAESDP